MMITTKKIKILLPELLPLIYKLFLIFINKLDLDNIGLCELL